jgi:photosystem II stability/assembly factor-like uncharacterized protein
MNLRRFPMLAAAFLLPALWMVGHAQEAPGSAEPAEPPPAPSAPAPAQSTEPPAPAASDPAPAASESAPAADDAAAAGDEEPVAASALPEPPSKPFKDAEAEVMPLAAKSVLLDVERADGKFVAVGERGHVLMSSDGSKWTQSPAVPTRATLTALDFIDEQNGWAVGHDAAILRTSDGGQTWKLQYFHPALERPFLDVMFFDAQHGLAIGAYGLMMETTDGGENWNEFMSDIRADEWHFNGITRLNNGSLLITGETGGLALSTDAGKTWQRLASPYEGSYFGAIALGEAGAVIYGLRGNAYISNNVAAGGWTKLNTGTVQNLLGGTQLTNGDFILVGNNGTILRGSVSGGDMRTIPDPVGKPLAAVAGMEGGDLMVLGETGPHIIKEAAR